MHEFTLINCDTDSITICKPDGSPFTPQEEVDLLNELNSQFPEHINFSDDGTFFRFVVFKAKNYIMYDPTAKPGKQIKTKGSALKSSKIEIAVKEFQSAIVDSILHDRNDFQEIYHKYVKEILAGPDMKRWSSKKTVTKKVFDSPRENEAKLRRAIEGSEYREGDKCYVFFKKDKSLCLVEHFDGDFSEEHLLERMHKSSKIFDNVLPTAELFLNYKLKKNRQLLGELNA